MLHVVPTFDPVQVRGDLGGPVRVVTPMPRDQVLEEMSRFFNLPVVSPDATPVAESGDPQATIIDQAISKRADLIVMGTHGRRGFNRLLLGSVTERVLHEAPCPVLTVPPHAPADVARAVTFKRILCPIDFSPSALQAWDSHWTSPGKPMGASRSCMSPSGLWKRSYGRQPTSMFPNIAGT